MSHRYIDTPIHCTPSFHILVSSLHGCSVHRYIMFTHHCYRYSPVYMHVLFLYSCHMVHRLYYMYSCCMYIPIFLLRDCFPLLILIFPLLDMWAVDMRCVKLSATWIQDTGVTSRIPHLLFPVSRYLVICYQQSSGYVIMLHVPCIILVLAMQCTLNIMNTTWGWGRLDGWLGLVGWMSGSIVSLTARDVTPRSRRYGDVIATYIREVKTTSRVR